MLAKINEQLSTSIDPILVERLLECYKELKQSHYLGKHKPSELDSGHFVEVVTRILQYITNPDHNFTPLGTRLDNLDREVARFAQLPATDFHDSIRLHIPRAVQAIYGIRSRRGVAHLGGEVSANFTDSSFVMATCDWILTELIRLYYTSSLEEAQKLVNSITERKIPLIQDFNGYLKVLNPKLSVPNKILTLLYYRGEEGATIQELQTWVKVKSPSYIQTAVSRLRHERAHVHCANDCCFITRSGALFVEKNISLHL